MTQTRLNFESFGPGLEGFIWSHDSWAKIVLSKVTRIPDCFKLFWLRDEDNAKREMFYAKTSGFFIGFIIFKNVAEHFYTGTERTK